VTIKNLPLFARGQRQDLKDRPPGKFDVLDA
jgi:hypothetical protein